RRRRAADDTEHRRTGESMKERLGDYRIVREISRGGMGIVYLAEQVSLKRRVALKVLHSSSGFSQRQLDRFRREAAALARLHHPNIVPVYGIGEDAGVHYFSMDYIEGKTLDVVIDDLRRAARDETVRKEGTLLGVLTERVQGVPAPSTESPGAKTRLFERDASVETDPAPGDPPTDHGYVETIVRVVRDVARALHYAHEQGIVHRDVKPQNIILHTSGKPYVMDFGLARDEASSTLTM